MAKTTTLFAVIVYPEESGHLLAPSFKKQHVECLLVITKALLTEEINQRNYQHTIIDDGDFEKLISNLKEYPLLCVLPGSERAVINADKIASRLGLLANKPDCAAARYNKSAMAQVALNAGLSIPKQTVISSINDLSAYINNHKDPINWPVILKPAMSMGSEDVSLCNNTESLINAFNRVHLAKNRLGRLNKQCLVQEYLTGTEYAIDSISYNGFHYVTAFWQYTKSNSKIIGIVPFTSKRLLPFTGDAQDKLIAYLEPFLDAVGIKYGPAHTELIVKKNGTTTLMEIGARLHGGVAAMSMSKISTGYTQADICAEAYAFPQRFMQKTARSNELNINAEILLLIAPNNNSLLNLDAIDDIHSLESVTSIDYDKSSTTINRIAGLVTLYHDDIRTIKQDITTIRNIEKNSLYSNEVKTNMFTESH